MSKCIRCKKRRPEKGNTLCWQCIRIEVETKAEQINKDLKELSETEYDD